MRRPHSKLVLFHSMSSSSNALRSKKSDAKRKKKLMKELEKSEKEKETKLKKELEEEEKAKKKAGKERKKKLERTHREEKTIVRPGKIRVIEEEVLDEDDDIIPSPVSSFAKMAQAFQSKFDTQRQNYAQSMKKKREAAVAKKKSRFLAEENSGTAYDELCVRQSSSTYASSFDSAETPSMHIHKLFQDSAPDTVSSRAQLRTAIADVQNRVWQEKSDDETKDDSGPSPEEKDDMEDLRSLYAKYLTGKIEKKLVVRSGEELTRFSGYRERRLQRKRPKKLRVCRTTSSGNSVTSAPASYHRRPSTIDEMGFANFA